MPKSHVEPVRHSTRQLAPSSQSALLQSLVLQSIVHVDPVAQLTLHFSASEQWMSQRALLLHSALQSFPLLHASSQRAPLPHLSLHFVEPVQLA